MWTGTALSGSLIAAFLILGACGSGAPDTSADGENLACSTPAEAQSLTTMAFLVDGVERQFRLSTPATEAGVALPVLMAFHGGGGRSWPFPQQQEFEELVAQEEVILVYPLSELVPPNEGEWQLNTSDDYRQDIEFVETLIDKLSKSYCVDPSRVYATGYSLGSMFTYELACHLNTRFAAIASFAGTMPLSPNSCVMEGDMAVMHIHGMADSIISYDDQWDWKEWDSVGTMMDIPGLIDFWSEQHSCQEERETQTGAGVHLVHDACASGVRVEHHGLTGVDHAWPTAIDGVSTHAVIWDFLQAHRQPLARR